MPRASRRLRIIGCSPELPGGESQSWRCPWSRLLVRRSVGSVWCLAPVPLILPTRCSVFFPSSPWSSTCCCENVGAQRPPWTPPSPGATWPLGRLCRSGLVYLTLRERWLLVAYVYLLNVTSSFGREVSLEPPGSLGYAPGGASRGSRATRKSGNPGSHFLVVLVHQKDHA